MDKKCDKILNEMLDGVYDAFKKARDSYLENRNVCDYIERLGELTSILMSVKTGLVLSKPPMYVGSFPDFTDCKCESQKEEPV